MKKPLLLLLLASALWSHAPALLASAEVSEFRAFLRQWEEGQSRFLRGDPALWKQNASQREDVTILGAFGGYEKGWAEVGLRYDWAASQYKERPAKVEVDYVSMMVAGDLAFTVAIERQEEVRSGGHPAAAMRTLRATQIFRREEGAWKLLHRHADPLTEKKPPGANPQK